MDSATKYKVFTASVIKLYENVLVNETPRADVNYNITTPTNKDVVAELINPIRNITVTNNDGKMTHTFKENGESTFEYVDAAGNTGTAKAVVAWIKGEENPDVPTLPSFNLSLETPKETLNSGEQFEVNVKVKNMKNFKKGLIALTGKFEYDKEKLEVIEILEQNNWNLDENSFNDDNFKFVTESDKYITEEETIFKVKLKVKETIQVPSETIFKLVSIEGSNGTNDISTSDVQLLLRILEKEQSEISSNIYKIEGTYISRISQKTTVTEFKKNIETNKEITILDSNGNKV